ncbi:MAG: HIT family protein [Mycoplasmoidaceae bacterium]
MNCILCKIIKKEIPATILYEDDHTMCIMDINPMDEGHCLVFPKTHYENFTSSNPEDLKKVLLTSHKIAKAINNSSLNNLGINYLINENEVAGQEIMHLHFHLIPKYNQKEGFDIKINKRQQKTIDECFKLIKSSIVD